MHSGLKFLQLLRSPASSFLATRTSVLTYGHYSSGQCSSSVRRSLQAGYLSSAFKYLRLFGHSYRLWGAWTRSTWLASSDRPSILHSYLMGDWASHDMIDDANPLPLSDKASAVCRTPLIGFITGMFLVFWAFMDSGHPYSWFSLS